MQLRLVALDGHHVRLARTIDLPGIGLGCEASVGADQLVQVRPSVRLFQLGKETREYPHVVGLGRYRLLIDAQCRRRRNQRRPRHPIKPVRCLSLRILLLAIRVRLFRKRRHRLAIDADRSDGDHLRFQGLSSVLCQYLPMQVPSESLWVQCRKKVTQRRVRNSPVDATLLLRCGQVFAEPLCPAQTARHRHQREHGRAQQRPQRPALAARLARIADVVETQHVSSLSQIGLHCPDSLS